MLYNLSFKSLHTSALLRSSTLRTHPRAKVTAPATVAHQERSHSPWASFTLFWKGNFIFITTMVAAKGLWVLPGGKGGGEWWENEGRCCVLSVGKEQSWEAGFLQEKTHNGLKVKVAKSPSPKLKLKIKPSAMEQFQLKHNW